MQIPTIVLSYEWLNKRTSGSSANNINKMKILIMNSRNSKYLKDYWFEWFSPDITLSEKFLEEIPKWFRTKQE
jgi:hypothetical protein